MHHPSRQSPLQPHHPSAADVVMQSVRSPEPGPIDYDAWRTRAVQLRREAIAQCGVEFVRWWRGVWKRRASRSLPIGTQGDTTCHC